ncbi:phosphonate ABC transporter ATP-binding protein [Leptolyngbya sp. FACHB-261]|uniref:phosphonate ABC transporter ATP-binding protein n=1 Tax=Leptolyngbya sp. FACHB-261 TaxID=2692806 RepID=UPI001689218F|nr:phosphonate ABC transporter ATP-binding protein [Leptolyngbya sp. FACHB-261]MBD2101956.1 phosphonate ABC transporter ATP-binding protein [Leptolyngbya sp. FACHB-261]
MLVVENLSKTYAKGAVALRDVSFALQPRSFTAVLGPSGAGKSTLLRCILQLLPPDSGQVWFQAQDLTCCSRQQLGQARRQIALVAQQFNLVRRRSALENCLAGRLQELPLWRCLLSQFPPSLLREALAALERVQLLEVAFQPAQHLSGGQQQRVAIARALTQRAKLLLADEPVASLDPDSAHRVLSLLRSLCDQEGLTVLCNLHQVDLAKQYSDRVLGIRGGELVLDTATCDLDETMTRQVYRA